MKSKSIKKMRTKLEKIYDKLRLNNEIKNKKNYKKNQKQKLVKLYFQGIREKRSKKKKVAH
jgi:hypothetical protein